MKRITLQSLILCLVLLLFVPEVVLERRTISWLPPPSERPPFPDYSRKRASTLQYQPHSSISIDGNADFTDQATAENWPGNGSDSNPFIITNLLITGTPGERLIDIRNTDVHFKIIHCYLSQGETIFLQQVRNGHFYWNIITNSSGEGILLEGSNYCSLAHNTVINSHRSGIRLEDSGNNHLINNTVNSNRGNGIEIRYSYNTNLFNNTISYNRRGIYQYESDYCVLVNNTATTNHGQGIYLRYSEYNEISGNLITNNSEYGLIFERSGSNIIRDNVLRNNSFLIEGQSLEDYSQIEVENNTIDKKPLLFWQQITGGSISSGVAGVNILVDCHSTELINQNVTGITAAFCSNLSICNNTIIKEGLHIENSPASLISDNIVVNSSDYGIFLDFSENSTLVNNTVTNCTLEGIIFRNSENSLLTNNTVTKNGRTGIYLDDSFSSTLSHNNVTNNGGEGILVYYSDSCILSHNIVFNNEQTGIFIYRSETSTLSHNLLNDNSGRGLTLRWSGGSNILNNHIAHNTQTGLVLDYSVNNRIKDNTFQDNSLEIIGNDLGDYLQAEVDNNSVNNKPIIYWQHVTGDSIPNGVAGSIILVNCHSIEVTNQNVMGIMAAFSTNLSIQFNIIRNSNYGIRLDSCEDIIISSNTIANNTYGIQIEHFQKVQILNNIIENNKGIGVKTYYSPLKTLRYNGHEYHLLPFDRTWADAKADCEARGGHLVTITSPQENAMVTELLSGYSAWIGLTDENTEREWQWVTGEAVTYTNWGWGQPDDSDGEDGEDYAEIYGDGEWNDFPGSRYLYYVCEWDMIQTTEPHPFSSISGNKIINNSWGIHLRENFQIRLSDNFLENNSLSGLKLDDSGECNITNNQLVNNGGGIELWASFLNNIINNTVTTTLGSQGFLMDGGDSAYYFQADVRNNTINKKPLIFWQHTVGGTVQSGGGQIILVNCSHLTVKNQQVASISGFICTNLTVQGNIVVNGSDGIRLGYSQSSLISDNIVLNSTHGIDLVFSGNSTLINNMVINTSTEGISLRNSGKSRLIGNMVSNSDSTGIAIGGDSMWHCYYSNPSDDCILTNNTVKNNNRDGIALVGSSRCGLMNNTVTANTGSGIALECSSENYIFFNTVAFNNGTGIHLNGLRSNTLAGNTIYNNQAYGIQLYWGDNNRIHNNYLGNNNKGESQAYDGGDNNLFDYNFWADWLTPDEDHDGIVDYSYLIEGPAINSDHYPLVTSKHLVLGFIISPREGETIRGIFTLEWTAMDSLNHDITYLVSYSNDESMTWTSIQTGLKTPSYNLDTRTVSDGSPYLIQVNASCSEGQWSILTSNSFTIDNSRHFQPFNLLSPTGGEIFTGAILIQWAPAEDIFNHNVTYSISYSADNGVSWVPITLNLTKTTYLWDTLTVADGFYFLQVNASCEEGSWQIVLCNTPFKIDNVPSSNWSSSTPLSNSSDHYFDPLTLLPFLQLLGLGSTLFFVATLVIIIRRSQKDY
ncbi:MAG: NosD domain-containing protein [Promethearchaeota archaeon]